MNIKKIHYILCARIPNRKTSPFVMWTKYNQVWGAVKPGMKVLLLSLDDLRSSLYEFNGSNPLLGNS